MARYYAGRLRLEPLHILFQTVNLQFPNCLHTNGTGTHELMHALGFYHEQARPDRDDWVYIAKGNVQVCASVTDN